MGTDKLWGGRFSGNTDATVEAFTASEHFDRRLAQYDIEGSRAHALMLQSCGIISEADGRAIIGGLDTIMQASMKSTVEGKTHFLERNV